MNPNRCITRVENGWWVRFRKNIDGKPTHVRQRTFRDADYLDGPDEALFWAREWRDAMEEELGVNRLFEEDIRPNNKSGVTGVYYTEYWRKVKGRKHKVFKQHWVSAWCEDKKKLRKKFPVGKYGYEEARRLAVEYRKKMESELKRLKSPSGK